MNKKKIDSKHELLRKTILKQLIVCGYSKQELALKLNISISSLYNKLKNPDTFTLKEIKTIYHFLKLSESEFMEVI